MLHDLFELHPESLQMCLHMYQREFVYGSQSRDETMRRQNMKARYGHLARVALIHYAGRHYSAGDISVLDEYKVRIWVANFVRHKVVHKGGYDWNWIDCFLKKNIGELLNIPLGYNKEILDRGMDPQFQKKHFGSSTLAGDTLH